MPPRGRALIIGGGIGGMAVANGLQRLGMDVAVFEQAPKLEAIGAAIGIQTNAIKALRHLGCADAVVAKGVEIETYEYRSWRGSPLFTLPQGDIGRRLGAPNVVVHRAELQDALLGGLKGDVVTLGAPATGFEQDEAGVTARFSNGRTERGEILIAADGIGSVIRRQLWGETPIRYSGWIAWRAMTRFQHPAFPIGFARQWIGRGRSFGMWHLGGGRVYWVGTARMPEGGSDEPGGRKRQVLSWFGNGQEPIAALIDATDESAMLRNDVRDLKPLAKWSVGRVTLLGDAAHATTPVTGQGGGQAIEDAAVLSKTLAPLQTLADRKTVEAAFAAYEAVRVPRTTEVTNEAWILSKMHHWSNPLLCSLRDLSLRLQPQKLWIKRMESRLASYTE
jgi:2-polyprenyl-6-methoxyphenol hydroxylase-like FAD-dependent oxidoreductase